MLILSPVNSLVKRAGQDTERFNTGKHLGADHRETHGCVVSTEATNALVLKHHAISIHNAD